MASILGRLLDKEKRSSLLKMLGRMNSNPLNLFRPASTQSFMIIEPIDFEADGRQDMCDACPDITVHDGKLVRSCRLEEMNTYGSFVQTYPRNSRQTLSPDH